MLVEAAVADKLPHSVLLGTDAPVLVELLEGKEKALMVTQSQACKRQLEQSREKNEGTSSDSGEVMESTTSGDKGAEGEVELESKNSQSRNSDLMEPSEQDDVW